MARLSAFASAGVNGSVHVERSVSGLVSWTWPPTETRLCAIVCVPASRLSSSWTSDHRKPLISPRRRPGECEVPRIAESVVLDVLEQVPHLLLSEGGQLRFGSLQSLDQSGDIARKRALPD